MLIPYNSNPLSSKEYILYKKLKHLHDGSVLGYCIKHVLSLENFSSTIKELQQMALDNKEGVVEVIGKENYDLLINLWR